MAYAKLLLRALGLLIGIVLCLPLIVMCPALAMHMAAKCFDLADESERWWEGD